MLLAALLVGSLSFPGIAIAGISAPDCGLTWEWVCVLSFSRCMPWPSPSLIVGFLSSHPTLSVKVPVRSQRS